MKKQFVVVCIAAFGAWCARAEIRPAGTVTFADLPTIASHVASLGKGMTDPILTHLVPTAIRNQGAAKLFGPMRPGSSGVAVCYVDAAKLARSDGRFPLGEKGDVFYAGQIYDDSITRAQLEQAFHFISTDWNSGEV